MRTRIGRCGLSVMVAAGVVWAGAGCESASKSSSAAAVGVEPGARALGPGSSAELERFLRIRTPSGAALAPDGTLYVRDWPDGVFQVYKVTPPAMSKDAPSPDYRPGRAAYTRLTNYKDGASGFSLSPDGRWGIITHAVGGNENFQLALLDTRTDAVRELTDKPGVQYSINAWLDDSSGFFFSGNQDSPNDFYLYRYDLASGSVTRVLANEGSWSADDSAPGGSRVLVSKYNSISDSRVYELDTGTGSLKDLTILGDQATASNRVVGYMPDFRRVMLISDHVDGSARLYMKDLSTGEITTPIPSLGAHELDGAGMNAERTLLAVASNRGGFGVPTLYRLPSFEAVALPAMEEGVASITGVRGNTLTWSMNNARTPGLAFAASVPPRGDASGASVVPLTFAETQGVDLSRFPLPDLVTYRSFDGLEIPAFVFFPPGYDRSRPRPIPFICLYHGGPEGQHRPVFSAANQYLLTRGFGIILPNVRGSTGYGRAFHMKDDYKNRWDSVRDGVAAARYLVEKGYAEPGRIATFGGSYGGYMSVACLVEDSMEADRTGRRPYFGAGVNIVGIVNLKTFLEKTSGYRRKLREAEYGPLTDPEFLLSVSPLEKIDHIRVPMLIAHGANDPRVPLFEAIQLAAELMKRGYDPEQVYFPDEGHGFAKLENRIVFNARAAAFLTRTIAR
ncbi:MAG: S9 family peptidase [Phycisphaeraceae bacterium]|nr:MAG: S9 family peptidase [Phycisphaeraceae bacterium]